jgi:hypothetical protein
VVEEFIIQCGRDFILDDPVGCRPAAQFSNPANPCQKNMQKMVLNCMGQDVLQPKRAQTELEYLNGYFFSLADRFGCRVPYNRAVYWLCKQHFIRPDFKPLDIELVWEEIHQQAAR